MQLTLNVAPGDQKLLQIKSRLERFSPLAFSDEALEREFLSVQQSYGADLASLHFFLGLAFACLLAQLLPSKELPRAITFGIMPLLGLAFKRAFPASFHAHIQVRIPCEEEYDINNQSGINKGKISFASGMMSFIAISIAKPIPPFFPLPPCHLQDGVLH